MKESNNPHEIQTNRLEYKQIQPKENVESRNQIQKQHEEEEEPTSYSL